MRRLHVLFGIVLAGMLLSGCAGPKQPSWLSWNPNQWSNRSDVDEPLLIDVAGALVLDIESFNGDVMIRENPKLTQASITVVRESVHGSNREKEGAATLSDITATAEIVPGELGQVLQVRTSTINVEPYFQRAHLYIEAPDIEGTQVKTTNGRVYAQGIAGWVNISTTHGDVRVMTNQAMRQPVSIINRDGSIDYRVRGESAGVIDAQTVNGRASVFVKHGDLRIKPGTGDDVAKATLNEGANLILLRTVNGNIRVAVVHNPEQVGMFIR